VSILEFKRLGRTDVMVSAIGMGTWGIGGFSAPDYKYDEMAIRALRRGIELGITLIDTAEMYGGGHSEEVVGMAIKGLREKVFIATKVWYTNLRYDDVLRSAEKSLKRLQIDTIDLYQVHWPNPHIPLSETMRAMERLVLDGKVRFIGVSNFSVKLMEEARAALSKIDIVSNQVEYSLLSREVEDDILPYCEKENITLIAYSPLGRGNILNDPRSKILREVAKKYNKTLVQVALNWLIAKKPVVAIPKAINLSHVEENVNAAGWRLSDEDLELLSRVFI
jgi:diketogulonate reductase-like aldo/keto reductase